MFFPRCWVREWLFRGLPSYKIVLNKDLASELSLVQVHLAALQTNMGHCGPPCSPPVMRQSDFESTFNLGACMGFAKIGVTFSGVPISNKDYSSVLSILGPRLLILEYLRFATIRIQYMACSDMVIWNPDAAGSVKLSAQVLYSCDHPHDIRKVEAFSIPIRHRGDNVSNPAREFAAGRVGRRDADA